MLLIIDYLSITECTRLQHWYQLLLTSFSGHWTPKLKVNSKAEKTDVTYFCHEMGGQGKSTTFTSTVPAVTSLLLSISKLIHDYHESVGVKWQEKSRLPCLLLLLISYQTDSWIHWSERKGKNRLKRHDHWLTVSCNEWRGTQFLFNYL